MDKEEGFVNRPPLLDDSNYDYWKSRISVFLKSIDSKTWKSVLKGWEHPVALDKDENRTAALKPEEEWTTAEDDFSLANTKALNALFNGVVMCKSASARFTDVVIKDIVPTGSYEFN